MCDSGLCENINEQVYTSTQIRNAQKAVLEEIKAQVVFQLCISFSKFTLGHKSGGRGR